MEHKHEIIVIESDEEQPVKKRRKEASAKTSSKTPSKTSSRPPRVGCAKAVDNDLFHQVWSNQAMEHQRLIDVRVIRWLKRRDLCHLIKAIEQIVIDSFALEDTRADRGKCIRNLMKWRLACATKTIYLEDAHAIEHHVHHDGTITKKTNAVRQELVQDHGKLCDHFPTDQYVMVTDDFCYLNGIHISAISSMYMPLADLSFVALSCEALHYIIQRDLDREQIQKGIKQVMDMMRFGIEDLREVSPEPEGLSSSANSGLSSNTKEVSISIPLSLRHTVPMLCRVVMSRMSLVEKERMSCQALARCSDPSQGQGPSQSQCQCYGSPWIFDLELEEQLEALPGPYLRCEFGYQIGYVSLTNGLGCRLTRAVTRPMKSRAHGLGCGHDVDLSKYVVIQDLGLLPLNLVTRWSLEAKAVQERQQFLRQVYDARSQNSHSSHDNQSDEINWSLRP